MKHLNEMISKVELALKHLKLAKEAFSKLNLDVTMDKMETVKEEESEEALYLKQFCENSEVHKELVERLMEHTALKEYIEEHKKQANRSDFGTFGKMTRLNASSYYSGINFYDSKQGYKYWLDILG